MSLFKMTKAMEHIDDDLISEAASYKPEKRKNNWIRWSLAAACFCLLAVGIVRFAGIQKEDPDIQKWKKGFAAADYFLNSDKGGSPSGGDVGSLVMSPFAVDINNPENMLENLENQGLLPEMPEGTETGMIVDYHGDGSLYKVTLYWERRSQNGLAEYSDLRLLAAPGELHELCDVIYIPLDEDGKPISESVTVTKRDGILIYAVGRGAHEKAITWQTDRGWYQIIGSWNDSYEDMVALLDWFWEHPFDLAPFETPPEGTFVSVEYADMPEAFSGQVPDFEALGYTAVSEKVNLGLRGDLPLPVWFEGIYTREEVTVRWTISCEADADAWANCLGRPEEVTEEKLTEAVSKKQELNFFFDMPSMASLRTETGTAADIWEIIRTLCP